jgi:branched-chain amino acid aminotransferase
LALVQWAKAMRDGVHLIVAATRHVPPSCFDSKVKYRSRLHYYLAEREARAIDHEAMALLLDLEGNVTETNTGNVLIVTKGVVETPTTTNTLPGVSRAVVMELAGELGLTCRERDLQIHDILRADEMFLSSTPYCLLPVTRVSGVPVGSGRPGPWHRRLLSIWSERVGVDIAEQMTNGLEG